MASGYKVGQKFARDGKTMQIISVNPDGTATYSEYDHHTGKLKKGFQGNLPAITQETIEIVNMLNVGAAEIGKEDYTAKTIEEYERDAADEKLRNLKKQWRETEMRLVKEEEEKTKEAVAKLDQLPPEKTWRAGGLIQIPAILSNMHEWERSGSGKESEEAKKEFIFKLVGLVKLVEYVQHKHKETKIPAPYSEKTLNLLEEVKTDIIDGKMKIAEAKKVYPESVVFEEGEKVVEATSVSEFILSLNNDLKKSVKTRNAFKTYIKKVQNT